MNFADRIKQEAQERKKTASRTKKVTRTEFVKVVDVIAENEQNINPDVAASVIHNGFTFMSEMDEILFHMQEGIGVTEEEFYRAANKTIEDMRNRYTGRSAAIRPLAGAIFADKVRTKLFHNEEDLKGGD